MKKIVVLSLSITLTVLAGATLIRKISAACPPTWDIIGARISYCPNPERGAEWKITWAGGGDPSYVSNEAYGQCCDPILGSSFRCDPEWTEPYWYSTTEYYFGTYRPAAG